MGRISVARRSYLFLCGLSQFSVTTEILLFEHDIGRVGLLCARIFGHHCSDGELEEGCSWVKGSTDFHSENRTLKLTTDFGDSQSCSHIYHFPRVSL